MKISREFFFILFIFLSIMITAQSNLIIDEILTEDKAALGKTVYLVLTASGLISEEASVQESLKFLEGTGWKIKIKDINEPSKLGEFCFMIMKSLNIPGGFLYSIFPGPRYASRELKYLEFFTGSSAANRVLSGEEVLNILGKALAWKEGEI